MGIQKVQTMFFFRDRVIENRMTIGYLMVMLLGVVRLVNVRVVPFQGESE
jgi:hypothetical protein